MQAQNPAIFVENLQEVFPSHLPCLPGQDIKSDGFSIETCKIMVDMLDVSLHVPPSTQVGGLAFHLQRLRHPALQKGPGWGRCRTVVTSDPVWLQMREIDLPHALATSTGSWGR